MIADSQVHELAAALTGSPVDEVRPVRGGGNSRLYRVASAAGVYALKRYPPAATDPRDRLGHEFTAFTFLATHGVTCVPRALAQDPRHGCALYEWIDGEPVRPQAPAIDAMLALMGRLHALREDADALALPAATEAVVALDDLHAQIDRRLARLRIVAGGEPRLRAFLNGALQPEWERRRTSGTMQPLPRAFRTLSPSDFGTHNMLERRDGRMAFVDFEYFGWDDPVKLVSDVLWHPGMTVPPKLGDAFVRGATALYGADTEFAERFATAYPLYGLRWALIVLNEFLPDRWEQRRLAGDATTWAAAKARQLDKSIALLDRVRAI